MKKTRFFIIAIFIFILISAIFYKEYRHYNFSISEPEVEENIDYSSEFDKGSYFIPTSYETSYNNELQKYISEQVQINGNHVELTANFVNNGYISGKVESKDAIKYGTFSFRIKTTQKRGLFPAIWFLPINGGALPELDIYEMVGQHPNEVHGVIHLDKSEGHSDSEAKYSFIHNINSNQINNSYILKFEWTPEKITWYIDDVIVGQTENCIDEPMYMIMNLAVGGDWPGNPDNNAFPETFDVEILEFSPKETYPRL